ncbi:MAG: FtsX-like permease family protein [Tissierellales bacterium]
MKIWDIAKRGLKGRKKDTLLLKLVITLSFIFIVTSTIFEASINKTKQEQRIDLYSEWHAAYLKGDEETLERLKKEPAVDKAGISLIIGESDKAGVVGSFNQDLIDMGRFSLYKGSYPEASNEIMLELNQMSKMNLDLEVGQKIQVAIPIQTVDGSMKEYIKSRNEEFNEINEEFNEIIEKELENVNLLEVDWLIEEYKNTISETGELPEDEGELLDALRFLYRRSKVNYNVQHHIHHETPFEEIGDVTVVGSNDYLLYYFGDEEVSPEAIRKKGLLRNQKIILKKEFIVTGILETYSDKWDLGGYQTPNAFITEEGAKGVVDAFYGTTIGDFSNYKMDYNIFLYSNSAKENLYSQLASEYPNIKEEFEEDKSNTEMYEWYGRQMFGLTNEEIDSRFESVGSWNVSRLEVGRDDYIEGTKSSENKMEVNTDNFRRNTFTYPEVTASTEYVLTLTIIAVIFIATALAIFQIFLTQMKRRARKIVLLKSIGATNGQIIKILICEGLYLLRTGLVIGIPGGFGLAALIVYGMNAFGGRNLQFYVIPTFLILGILAGCLALFIGMSVPMLFAIRIPLVGAMSKPPKHKKIKHKSNNEEIMKRQTFAYINWRYFKLNKGKTLISFGISFITITIILTTILLSYLSFDNYKTTVLANNRPDYAMETFYGESTRTLSQAKEDLMNIDGVEHTEIYKVGKQTFLWYEGIEENKILNDFKQLLPGTLLPIHFSSYDKDLEGQPEWISNAFYTKVYGVDSDSELFNRYNSTLTEGSINKEAFEKGEEVILLIPLYLAENNNNKKIFSEAQVVAATNESDRMRWLFEQSGTSNITYNSRFNKYYYAQKDIKPGDTIYLSSDDEKIAGDNYAVSFTSKEVKVGGIIHYFPRQGMWPFTNNVTPYVVIGSINCMESIYPGSKFGLFQKTLSEMKSMVDSLYPTKHGRTLWYINTDSREQDTVLDSKLLAYANNNGYTLYNYKNSSSQLYQEAFNNAIIIGLLGLTAAAIAFIILYNTMVSKMEQDKNRIGILQSFGVTKTQFSKHYIRIGTLNGLLSALIANILLIIVLFITSLVSIDGISMTFSDYIKDIFLYKLWLYPWTIHLVVCLIFLILTVLTYYLPSRNVTKQYPVENIRSLGR